MFNIKENLKKLPETPGVYMHKDGLGNVIYVGKAKNLRRRVSSYFVRSASHSSKVKKMVSQVSEFEYITTKTEVEALILECNLIKKYEPKYNVLLRDDKTYPYIKVTVNDNFPRIVKTRRLEKDGAKYFGPYSDVGAVNRTVGLLNKLFSLKRCTPTVFPEDFRPCLNYHIGECKGICIGEAEEREYRENIEKALEFLSGRSKALINEYKDKMNRASEEMRFEEAAECRDFYFSLKALGETQRVSLKSSSDLDMLFPIGSGEDTSVVLFSVRDGKLSGRETFHMKTSHSPSSSNERDIEEYDEVVGGFIKQYYTQLANPPREILLQKPLKDAVVIKEMLRTEILVPKKGDKYKLLKLAEKDILEMSKLLDVKIETAREREDKIKEILSKIIGVKKEIYRVEAYDVSNTNGIDTVGAMVVFFNLRPAKKEYRRFRIRTIEGQDDYGSLREMLLRRFRRGTDNDEKFGKMPDLILMDGGLGQVRTAVRAMEDAGVNVPVLGMAKDDSHRTRALVNSRGEEIELKGYPFLFKYYGTVQEEVHRFAIEYHKSIRNKRVIGSVLDEIQGIGPVKRNALLSHFETIDDIKTASIDELKACKGITEKNADAIYTFFHIAN